MCLSMTPIEESRPIIWDPSETYNPWVFPSENGKTSVWTSLCVCLAPCMGTTQYRSSWIAWVSQSTSYLYPPPTGSDSIPSSTCHTLFAIMASQRPSSPIEDLSSLLVFGSNYMSIWAPISSRAQLIIRRLTDRLNESTKSSKICFVLVFWRMVQNRIYTFH
jgi:hypothetical protein